MTIEMHDSVYVDGAFVPAIALARRTVENPATGEIIAEVPACGVRDVDRAVEAARAAFDSEVWSSIPASERAETLTRLADELEANSDSLARTISMETGLPRQIAGPLHVTAAIGFVRYYAELARNDSFEEVRPSTTTAANVRVRRCPVGVVAALAPWNIPLLGVLSKIAPALAAGCTVVVKPAPETPLTAYWLAESVHNAGFPAGVVNILPADDEGSRRLVAHPGVDMVAFTGSTGVGRQIAQTCAKDLRRVSLELGGNAAAIVLDDAPAELIGAGLAMTGLALNNGQACIAQRRVLVPRRRYDEIVALLAAAANSLCVGDPAQATTVIGPLISEQHRSRVLAHIRAAEAEGAVVLAGGGVPEEFTFGYYVQPTVLSQVDNNMRVAREEVFGPVICVIPYDTVEEAVSIALDTEFGLSSSVWTADIARGEEVARQLRVGTVYINATLTLDPGIPFGGFGHSGIGRELGPEGLDEYCEVQSIFVPTGS